MSIQNYQTEVICGFEVSSMMKRVWAGDLRILREVISICERNHITYYADYGTLLGTIRHQGFVPWDDDIDICLKRPEYNRLIQALRTELPEGMFLNSCYTNANHSEPMSSVTNGQHLPLSDEVMAEYHGCPYIVGIDIYALDYMPDQKEYRDLQVMMYDAVYDLANRYDEMKASGELDVYLPQLEEMCGTKLVRDDALRARLWQLGDRICSMFTEEECESLTYFPRVVQGDVTFRYQKQWYQDVIYKEFEGIRIAVPSGYHEILTRLYGDYMEHREGVSSHEYPCYQKQREYLASIGRYYE